MTQTVAQIVQTWAEVVGLDDATFSDHSMRIGFATSAVMVGVEERKMNEVELKLLTERGRILTFY